MVFRWTVGVWQQGRVAAAAVRHAVSVTKDYIPFRLLPYSSVNSARKTIDGTFGLGAPLARSTLSVPSSKILSRSCCGSSSSGVVGSDRGSSGIMELVLQPGDSWGGEGLHYAPPAYEFAVIFLHGLGDTAHGWQSLMQMLYAMGGPVLSKTKFILPTAMTIPITMNFGFRMPAWADIRGLSPSETEDEAGYLVSVDRLNRIVEGEISKGIPSRRVVVGGFSQGAAVAYLTTLLNDRPLAGVVALSGWLPLARQQPAKFAMIPPGTLSTPILHCHGTDDPMVNFKWGSATVDLLKSMGFRVQLQAYPDMGHSATEEELDTVARFIQSLLGAPDQCPFTGLSS